MIRAIHQLGILVVFLVPVVSIACEGGSSGASSGGAGTDAAAQAITEDADTIPCEPRAVLVTVCQTCHSRSPQRGAPFPLVTRSNIVRVAPNGEIRKLMIDQLTARRMPLAPVTIGEAERTVLLDWLQAGAPAVSPRSCVDAGVDAAASPEARDASTPETPSDDAGTTEIPDGAVVDACGGDDAEPCQ